MSTVATQAQGRAYRRPAARPASDAQMGMEWWNRLTRIERLAALQAAGTATPAVAWEFWKLRQMAVRGNRAAVIPPYIRTTKPT